MKSIQIKKWVLLIIVGLSLFCNYAFAQKELIFEHSQIDKVYTLKKGDYLKIGYRGYLHQPRETVSYIQAITDTLVVFSLKGKKNLSDDRVVRVSDVTGFRKMWKYRPLVIPLTNLAVGIGTYFAISNNDKLSDSEKLLYSTGAIVASSYLLKFLFKDDIKLKISDGWTARVGTGQRQ